MKHMLRLTLLALTLGSMVAMPWPAVGRLAQRTDSGVCRVEGWVVGSVERPPKRALFRRGDRPAWVTPLTLEN